MTQAEATKPNSPPQQFDISFLKRVFIEPCFNLCNLYCLHCPVGRRLQLRDTPSGMMPLTLFRKICKRSLGGFSGEMALYNWGEPFLNPDLPGMVRYAKAFLKVRLLLNSNFSWRFDDRVLAILDCLEDDTIVISCDGYSQETCEKYRVGVNFDQVMHNINLMCEHKKPQTQLLWQYLRFPWNPGEEVAAEKFCKSRGIRFYLGTGGIVDEFPIMPYPRTPDQTQSRCNFFRNSLSINYDGEVYPCCSYYGPSTFSLGNAAKISIEHIFQRGKGKKMLDYLTFQSGGDDSLFCKHCVERDLGLLELWKQKPVELTLPQAV
jgi:radical SAM protein with 4Fe4S-binding SPASM domain